MKAAPPAIPEPVTGDPNAIIEDDDWIIRNYGDARRQVIALVSCINDWRDKTRPAQ